jgi:hypothetical protein
MAGFAGLLRVDDPRDNLEKAKRPELLAFARQHGVTEIKHDMPAIIMRRILRAKRLTDIKIPRRILGQPESRGQAIVTAAPENVVSFDAADDLMRQYQAGAMAAPAPSAPSAKPYEQMTRAELAKTCKARNIPMARTDKKEMLMEKLRGKDAA